MKKYIIPSASVIALSEESNLMILNASNQETTDTNYFSNKREDEKPAGSSIWDN